VRVRASAYQRLHPFRNRRMIVDVGGTYAISAFHTAAPRIPAVDAIPPNPVTLAVLERVALVDDLRCGDRVSLARDRRSPRDT
jgi:hypothetical protein